jgi:hypothetical protein
MLLFNLRRGSLGYKFRLAQLIPKDYNAASNSQPRIHRIPGCRPR